VQGNSDSACTTITELADTLVRVESLSFRQAHKISADTAQATLLKQLPLCDSYSDFEKAFKERTNRAPSMDKNTFARAVSMESFVNVRDRFGGPAPAAMDDALDHYLRELAALIAKADSVHSRSSSAKDMLDAAFGQLLEL